MTVAPGPSAPTTLYASAAQRAQASQRADPVVALAGIRLELPADFAHLVVVDRAYARLAVWRERWRATGMQCCMVRQALQRPGLEDRSVWCLDAVVPKASARAAADAFNAVLRQESTRGMPAWACADRPADSNPRMLRSP